MTNIYNQQLIRNYFQTILKCQVPRFGFDRQRIPKIKRGGEQRSGSNKRTAN